MHIRPADRSERNRLAFLLADAFQPLPPSAWLFPNAEIRRIRFPAYAAIWIDHGLEAGTVDVVETPDGRVTGLAIWWPEPGMPSTTYDQRLIDAVGSDHLDRFTAFDAALAAVHPTREHLYLAFAAVASSRQGRGYGRALLEARHAHLDAASMPSYLVAACPDSQRLYQRYGYVTVGPAIRLPDGCPMQPMWREPVSYDHRK